MKLMRVAAVVAVAVLLCGMTAYAGTTDCNFDTFVGSGTVPDGYCGINWGGVWTYYDSVQPPYNPHTPPERVYSPDTGAGEYQFKFITPEQFQGAYFAGYNFAELYYNLYYQGNLVYSSINNPFLPSDTPTFYASGYNGLVDTVGIFSQANDFYVMDDVTYGSGGGSVPEPASLLLLGSGLLALGNRGRKLLKK